MAEKKPRRFHARRIPRTVDYDPEDVAQVPVPSDEFGREIHELIREFKTRSEYTGPLGLPATLSAGQRKRVHALAEAFRVSHVSTGKGKSRHIVIDLIRADRQAADQAADQAAAAAADQEDGDGGGRTVVECVEMTRARYIALRGPGIDRAAARATEAAMAAGVLGEEAVAAREARDGPHYHVTMIARKETGQIVAQRQASEDAGSMPWHDAVAWLMDTLTGRGEPSSLGPGIDPLTTPAADAPDDLLLVDDWEPVGVGSVSDEDGNTATFLVLEWESGNAALERVGLPPHDFHITLGFAAKDVHGVPKDTTTITVPWTD